MDYPKYKHKKSRPIGKLILLFVLLNFLLSFLMPWYTYVHGSILFIIMSIYMIKKHRGFKAFSGIVVSVLIMLLIFDFIDFEFTWSLDFVFPSFLIFMGVILLAMILVRKKSWRKHYDIHVYILLLNILMIILLLFGIIESNVMVIVTYSVIIATVIIIRLKVGKSYRKNIDKFTHL